jgi:hypothetical protein
MRFSQNQQMLMAEVDISNITFNPRSRDDIPKILRGLQHLYIDQTLRENIFSLLKKTFNPTSTKTMAALA